MAPALNRATETPVDGPVASASHTNTPTRPPRTDLMDADHERLAGRLDELERALLATETYLTQLRDIVTQVRHDLERLANPEADGVPLDGPPSGY